MTISVTKSQTGWIVTKDGQQYTITDKNNDGLFNKGDKIDCAEGANALNAEDMFNISYNVQLTQNGGEGVSAEDMARYAEYLRAAEDRDAAQADYDMAQRRARLAQRQAAQPRKKSFVEKVMPWLNLTNQAAMTAGTIYGTIKGDFWGLGMLGGYNWAYNCGNMADMAGLGFTGLSNTALWGSQLGSNDALWNSMGLNLSGITGGAAGMPTQEKAALTAAQNRVDAIINGAGSNTPESDSTPQGPTAAEQQAADNTVQELRKMYESSTEYDDSNLKYLDEHFPRFKDASEYTADDIAIINQMKATPFVPIESIDVDGSGDNPIKPQFAKKINDFIKAYSEDPVTYRSRKEPKDDILKILSNPGQRKAFTPESIQNYIDYCMSIRYGIEKAPMFERKNPPTDE